jgi:hypothetical protein
MDRDFLYALLDVFGGCWVIKDGGTEKVHGLPTLLGEGWRPCARRPSPRAAHTCSSSWNGQAAEDDGRRPRPGPLPRGPFPGRIEP